MIIDFLLIRRTTFHLIFLRAGVNEEFAEDRIGDDFEV